jgi:hypothetical protein
MRFSNTVLVSALGVALLGACAPAADSEAEANAEPEVAAATTGEITCYLQGGTLEDAAQRPSPLGETVIAFEGQSGKLCYGRPFMKERVVMGGLVPFGEPWRMGANEATAIHLPFAATVGGIDLEPGSYSIYAIPGELEWEFVLNRNSERWGIPIDDGVRSADIGSFIGLARQMTEPVEQFTVNWHTHGGNEGHLVLEWETTRVEIAVNLSGA